MYFFVSCLLRDSENEELWGGVIISVARVGSHIFRILEVRKFSVTNVSVHFRMAK